MPRDLFHLEGQQLRGLRDRIRDARGLMGHRKWERQQADSKLEEAATIISQILADGPHSRDEED